MADSYQRKLYPGVFAEDTTCARCGVTMGWYRGVSMVSGWLKCPDCDHTLHDRDIVDWRMEDWLFSGGVDLKY